MLDEDVMPQVLMCPKLRLIGFEYRLLLSEAVGIAKLLEEKFSLP